MNIRDQRQAEFADLFLERPLKDGGILYLCPRFGKCRVAIKVFKALGKQPKILIAYPDTKIKNSWLEEFKLVKYSNPNITFTTHLSLHKYKSESYDLVVLDEIHLLSENQIEVVQSMSGNTFLGLTGTLAKWTERALGETLGLSVLARYSIDQAISEGVLTDYEINVKFVRLDDQKKIDYKGKIRTEKQQFNTYSWIIDKMEREGKQTFFLRLARMRLIQNSLAKMEETKSLLKKFKTERVLVFAGTTNIADRLGIPVFHSKKGEKQVFEDFSNGKGNQLAVIKIGNTGVTYRPLSKVVINYFDSNPENLAQKINRCMAMEYSTPDKKANIWIISSTEDVERNWLNKALAFFDKNKIKYV
jgi:superfamily II DNA or RNA helicase